MQFHPLPTIVQIRNNCIVTYKDTSELNIVRNGCKDALKQNNKNTVYLQNIKELEKMDVIEDINSFADTYEYNYEQHNEQYLNPKGVTSKKLGTLSHNQMRKYKKIVENLVNYIYVNPKTKDYKKGDYCTFLTLTLPSRQIHSDKQINKVLVRFLENLKKTKNILNYVWKSETQDNGNIHYHILLDKWIDKDYINNRWNNQINSLGYVDRSISDNPPSTKIHSLGKVKNIVSYIQKYMTKQEHEKRPITAKTFGYSRSAGKLDYPKIVYEGLNIKQQKDLDSILKSKDLKKHDDLEYITLYTGKVFQLLRDKAFTVWKSVKKHYSDIKKRLLDIEYPKIESVKPFSLELKKQDAKCLNFSFFQSRLDLFFEKKHQKIDFNPMVKWLESLKNTNIKKSLISLIDLKIKELSHI